MQKNSYNKTSFHFEKIALHWPKYYRLNNYYHQDLQRLALTLIPSYGSIIEFGCREGELLSFLPNKKRAGVEISKIMLKNARKKNPKIKFYYFDEYENFDIKERYDYILLSNNLSYTKDVQVFVKKLHKICHKDSRIIVIYFNYYWKIVLELAEKIKLRLPQPFEPNWLDVEDIKNFFEIEKFDLIKKGQKFIFPYPLPFLSNLVNKYLAYFPLINNVCLTKYAIFRPKCKPEKYSVSVIMPARNEEGHIPKVLDKIPKMGRKTEVIFVENRSRDKTLEAIKKEVSRYRGPIKARYYSFKANCKKEAVFFGFKKAENDILMICDSDLTVDPKELIKFYNAMSNGYGEFINGSRLVYPMEKQAMRFLNTLANKFFSIAFSFLLDQKIKDTLCGTKTIFRKDYLNILKYRKYFRNFDPFGDFDLIFGASKLNLKIVEIPVRYKARTYGKTNINRFSHGWLLLKMTILAAKKIKFV